MLSSDEASVKIALPMTRWLALDIGGANLKAADGRGFALCWAFPLWRQPDQLAPRLAELLAAAPAFDRLAVTMTGELADCFQTKLQGVRAILEAIEQSVQSTRHAPPDEPVSDHGSTNDREGAWGGAERRPSRHDEQAGGNTGASLRSAPGTRGEDSSVHHAISVYLTNGRFVTPAKAIEHPLLAAASNWHALARFAARYLRHGTGLVIDIGSTTCDLIPVRDGVPATEGRTDPERLLTGELVYTGVTRSPVCALVEAFPWQGRQWPVAQELFATALDAYLLLEEIPEDPRNCNTADGRPATRAAARDRLARMICADRESFDDPRAQAAARAIAEAQLEKLARAAQPRIQRLARPPEEVVISGQGEFLARRLVTRLGFRASVISLGERLGPELSQVAPAHALAVLAAEQEP
jgi:probable H4MPT-linked C1 transfer pathway protein